MNDGARPERVEIDLTPRDETRRRWGRGGSADAQGVVAAPTAEAKPSTTVDSFAPTSDSSPAFDASTGVHSAPLDPGPAASGGGMRRLAAIAVGTGAVALLLGWVIGRSGGDDESATSIAPGTTQPVGSATTPAPGSTLPVVDPADLPTTTRPPRTTTTTQPPKWTIEPITVDGRAVELGLRVVAVASDGRLIEIDAAEGTMASIETSVRAYNGAAVYAGDDWVVVGDFDRGQIEVYRRFENAPQRLSIGNLWDVRWQPGTDRFWVTDQSFSYPGPMTIVERTVDGEDTGATIELNSRFWPSGADPAGGVIVAGQTGTFRVTPAGSERISTGYLLAIGVEQALVVECGESLDTCGTFVIDRATGDRTPLVIEGLADAFVESMSGYGMYGNDLAQISPDGRYAPVVMPSGVTPRFGVVDLENGSFIQLATYPQSALYWVPDGGHAVFMADDVLMVFDAGTGETFPLLALGPSAPGSFNVAAIALRPPD